MDKLKILNTREKTEIINKLNEQFGCGLSFENQSFLKNKDQKIFLIHDDIKKIDFDQLSINSIGLYFGKITSGDMLRVSIPGSQIVGPEASKHIFSMDEEQMKKYFKGRELEVDLGFEGRPFLLLEYKNDFFGSAKYKDNRLLNYIPKVHRSRNIIV